MKNITKDSKGITLIALIITVVVMLILVSVTTYTGIDTYDRAKISKFVTQMQLLQTKVDDLVNSKTTEELNNMQLQTVTTDEQENAINEAFDNEEISTNDTSKYKVFTKNKVLEILDVEDVQNDILVNFETREIVSVEGIEYEENTYYTQYKLPGGQTIVGHTTQTNRNTNFTTNLLVDGLNATIKVTNIEITNATLLYKESSAQYWQTATNYIETGKSYNILISKTGKYTVRLIDNANTENYTEKTVLITVTNKPKTEAQIEAYNYGLTSENWAYKQKENVNYVWIPRFAYKTNTTTNTKEIKFIKGNSNISTDNTYIDENWKVHSKFTTENGDELTGIWISVENLKQAGLDMVTLLNKNNVTTKTEI